MMMENEFDTFAIDEEVLAAATYARLAAPRHRGDIEETAAMMVVLMTQAIRMRVALMRIAGDDSLKKKKSMRKFAAQALEYTDSFTREDVLASYKRVAKPEEH
jgi:hypothetical protein